MPHRHALTHAALAVALFSPVLASAQGAARMDSLIAKTTQASYPEYFEMLSMPNDAIVPQDIQKNVQWLEAAFKRRGFTTQQLPNSGKPMLFAEFGPVDPKLKTVLFYMHLDGQPVFPQQWAQKSPWIPVLKQKGKDGKWEEIDATLLQKTTIDPEWRVFARASADDKGPIMMLLTAIDTLKIAGLKPRINVKVILDSEEEKGSPTITPVMNAHLNLLRADAIVIHDGPQHPSNLPTVTFGNRGAAKATLTVFGAKASLHSGHYGNYAFNPAQRMASLLASMKDDEGRVTIKGYYDRVKLGAAERNIMAQVPDDEKATKIRLGIARTESVGANYQEAMQYPSLNIRGMAAAAIGDKVATIVPDQAVAELDLRTTPEADGAYLLKLVENHIQKQGYYLVKDKPTDQERAEHDKIAAFAYTADFAEAARTPMDSAVGAWAYSALEKTFGPETVAIKPPPIRIRMMGGTVPTAAIVGALKVPFVIVPLVNADNNQHTHNENLRLGNYVNGVKSVIGLMTHDF